MKKLFKGRFAKGLRDHIIKNLRFRIFLTVLLAGIIPGTAALFGIVRVYESQAVSSRTVEVQTQCTILSNQIQTYDYFTDTSSEVINASISQLTSIYNGRVMVIDADLCIVKDTYDLDEGKTEVSSFVVRALQGESGSLYDKDEGYIKVTAPIFSEADNAVIGVIVVSVTAENILSAVNRLYTNGGVLLCVVLLVLAGLGVLLADRFVRPLHTLTQKIDSVNMGFTDEEIRVDNYTETRELSDAINKMLKRLRRLDESRAQFVSNVSHELKTPMTSMKVLSDSLLEQPDVPPEMYREFLGDIAREIDRENEIITDLLTLVKMDRSGQTLNITMVDINEFLEENLRRLRPIAQKAQVEIVMESIRPVTADADEGKLSLAVMNLVENAIKYNREGGWVHVTLNADHQFFTIEVADSGIGIPKEDLPHIFERFYRVDKSHSREIGGTGLGLSIAQDVVIAHKGTLEVSSVPGEGTVFRMTIPLTYAVS